VTEEHAPRPYTLVAELTYRCSLRCAYCSNPVHPELRRGELDAATWVRVFREAEELGVVQLHLTGGEPLLRDDLEELVAGARAAGLYTNLITSALPLTRERLLELGARGLDAVQISIQGTTETDTLRIAGRAGLREKIEAAGWVRQAGLPLTLNVVLHAENIDEVPALIDLARSLGAARLELANTQYLGWALRNRDALLPTPAQIERARDAAAAARAANEGTMEILFVLPDYHRGVPRACMDGWARRYLVAAPDGVILPCHAARAIPGLEFDSVCDRPLAWIWRESQALGRYRGEDWMPEPCRSCERRAIDHGGCRCQAYALTGDAGATDPACRLSPRHDLVRAAHDRSRVARAAGNRAPLKLEYRSFRSAHPKGG